mmetsp:Transcript_12277/g.14067  ORF Transcript_12277/g.14067 Transcript_12277/m.14067 type:complete len:208 (+) Transcript_12277:20-643(+)
MLSQLIALAIIALSDCRSTYRKIKFPYIYIHRKEYTPLFFFKRPKGECPQCDAMEKEIKNIEKDLGVKVERVNVGRNQVGHNLAGEQLFNMVSNMRDSPPLLYHRESRQTVRFGEKNKEVKNEREDGEYEEEEKDDIVIEIDKERVLDWAKGRKLSQTDPKKNLAAFGLFEGTDIEEMCFSEHQRCGKKAIRDYTEKKAAERKAFRK